MKVRAIDSEPRVVEMIGQLRASKVTYAEIARRLNDGGETNSWGLPWSRTTVQLLWQRVGDPETNLHRIDSMDGQVRLSLHILDLVASSDQGPRGDDARTALRVLQDGFKAGLPVREACDLAKDVVRMERDLRREEQRQEALNG